MQEKAFLWITDPWDTLDHTRDTTLRLIEETLAHELESYWCDVRSIRWSNSRVLLDAQKIVSVKPGRQPDGFDFGPIASFEPGEFRSLQYRPDPPVDAAYLQPLQLMSLALEMQAPSTRPEIVNNPSVLFSASEKTEGLLFPDYAPPTAISSRLEQLAAFGRAERLVVLKPLNAAQGRGVQLLDWTTPAGIAAAEDRLAVATGGFERPALLQRFLAGVRDGELRLWFLDGRLLAHARRFAAPQGFQINAKRELPIQPARLNAKDRAAAEAIGVRLCAKGIRLAAVDLIDGCITDFNFTSPGLLVELESVLQKNLARPIVTALAQATRRC